jgi:hypothetical protein
MTVMLEDGTEEPIHDHIRDAHHKGTTGLTEEYLDNMHLILHQRHAPDLEHVHTEDGDVEL